MAFVGKPDKEYGLIISKKSGNKSNATIQKANIFGEESDEEDKEFKEMKSFDMKKEALKAKMKNKTQHDLEKAIAEDPTIFEYDTVYDDIHREKEHKTEEKKKKSKTDEKKPKYMLNLLKTAEARKLERELQQERKVQADREAEAGEFIDKEAFVTASYKKKMEELKALELKQRQEELEEERQDVTKKVDMTSFYRYVLDSTTKQPDEKVENSTEEKTKTDASGSSTPRSSKGETPERNASKEGSENEEKVALIKSNTARDRQYRQRDRSSSAVSNRSGSRKRSRRQERDRSGSSGDRREGNRREPARRKKLSSSSPRRDRDGGRVTRRDRSSSRGRDSRRRDRDEGKDQRGQRREEAGVRRRGDQEEVRRDRDRRDYDRIGRDRSHTDETDRHPRTRRHEVESPRRGGRDDRGRSDVYKRRSDNTHEKRDEERSCRVDRDEKKEKRRSRSRDGSKQEVDTERTRKRRHTPDQVDDKSVAMTTDESTSTKQAALLAKYASRPADEEIKLACERYLARREARTLPVVEPDSD